MPWNRDRMTKGQQAVLDTACPFCHFLPGMTLGGPGQACTSSNGELEYFHRARIDAALERLASQ